jgi:hypothetical protein
MLWREGRPMTEAEWLACEDPKSMLEFLQGKVSDRKLRLFACAICRQLSSLVVLDEYGTGFDAAESLVDGGRKRAAMKRCRQALDRRMVELVSDEGRRREWTAVYLGHLAICENDYRNFARYLSEVRSSWRGDPFKTELWNSHLIAQDIFGNPFRPVPIDPTWLTSDVVTLTHGIYDEKAFDRLPILADALQDAGCDNEAVLNHCRGDGPHVRGCWVVDLVLGKE